MMEADNPKINVDELIYKISQELAKNKNYSSTLISDSNTPAVNSSISKIESLLMNAESRSKIRTKLPDKFHGFAKALEQLILKLYNLIFRDQREVNFNLTESLKESTALNKHLFEQMLSIQLQMEHHISAIDSSLHKLERRIGAVDNNLHKLGHRISVADNNLQELGHRISAIEDNLQKLGHDISVADNNWQKMDHRISDIDDNLQKMQHSSISAINNNLQKIEARISAVDSHLGEMEKYHVTNDSYLKNDLMQQKRLITLFLEEVSRRLPEPFNQGQLQTLINEEKHLLDAFYVAFEDHFRGSREEISNRLRVYLPIIQEAKVGTPDSPILDVGCGRGEWLELLRNSGYIGKGLDINRVMLEQCRTRGLEVIEADVIAYLRSLPDASLGAVTGFHIIEHLPFETLVKLFDETLRVLKPNGLIIFETPNPENVIVGSHTFYIDPTHRNPLPSPTIKFIAESRGLSKVTIIKLHPYEPQNRLTGSDTAERFNDYFYTSQDYAVLGFKP